MIGTPDSASSVIVTELVGFLDPDLAVYELEILDGDLELLRGKLEQLPPTSRAAATTVRPLLKVVCEPDEPPSYGPASVSW